MENYWACAGLIETGDTCDRRTTVEHAVQKENQKGKEKLGGWGSFSWKPSVSIDVCTIYLAQ
jgi:hypothetical protein